MRCDIPSRRVCIVRLPISGYLTDCLKATSAAMRSNIRSLQLCHRPCFIKSYGLLVAQRLACSTKPQLPFVRHILSFSCSDRSLLSRICSAEIEMKIGVSRKEEAEKEEQDKGKQVVEAKEQKRWEGKKDDGDSEDDWEDVGSECLEPMRTRMGRRKST